MRLVITGSRHWPLRLKHIVFDQLDKALEYVDLHNDQLHLYVGDCPSGVDSYVVEWYKMQRGNFASESRPPNFFLVQPFKANWKKFGNSAGPRRNTEMIQTAIYAVSGPFESVYGLAFFFGESKGTRNAAKTMLRLGIVQARGIVPNKVDETRMEIGPLKDVLAYYEQECLPHTVPPYTEQTLF